MNLKSKLAILVLKHDLDLHESTPVEFQQKLYHVFNERHDVYKIDEQLEELALDQEAETSYLKDQYVREFLRIYQDSSEKESNGRPVYISVLDSHK